MSNIFGNDKSLVLLGRREHLEILTPVQIGIFHHRLDVQFEVFAKLLRDFAAEHLVDQEPQIGACSGNLAEILSRGGRLGRAIHILYALIDILLKLSIVAIRNTDIPKSQAGYLGGFLKTLLVVGILSKHPSDMPNFGTSGNRRATPNRPIPKYDLGMLTHSEPFVNQLNSKPRPRPTGPSLRSLCETTIEGFGHPERNMPVSPLFGLIRISIGHLRT